MIRENPSNLEKETQREERLKRRPEAPEDRGIIDREPEPHREPVHELVAGREAADTERKTVYGASGFNIIAGLWLIIAPAALGYAAVEAALWNSVVIGIAVAVMAIVRVARPLEFEGISWTNFVLGIWLAISPFVLGLWNIPALVWNNILVGVIIVALAATSAGATRVFHTGTPGVTRPRP